MTGTLSLVGMGEDRLAPGVILSTRQEAESGDDSVANTEASPPSTT